MDNANLVVVGAGLGGMAVAIRLALQGKKVLVLEKNETYGGKLAAYKWEGFRWDRGPSLFTLPEQIKELFDLAGKSLKDYFEYVKMDYSCQYFFQDGSRLTIPADQEKRKELFVEIFGQKESAAAEEYIGRTKRIYAGLGNLFINHPKFGLNNIFDRKVLEQYPKLLSRPLLDNLDGFNRSYFNDERLIQIFNRFGTYNGSNPFKMSGIYSMVGSLELEDGVYFPKKGMRSIVDALYQLAIDCGVSFEFNQSEISVEQLDGGYKTESSGHIHLTKNVVSGIDVANFYTQILKDQTLERKIKKQERSSSGIVFYWAVDKIIPDLKLHNIFFGEDYKREFQQIFNGEFFDIQPTIYIHLSCVVNNEDAPESGQNWFVMINMPAGFKVSDQEKDKLRNYIYAVILKHFDVDIKNDILHESIWEAKDIEEITGAHQGALYGASSNHKLAALKRHSNTNKKYPGLYFCGGTVHPGGGIPLVLKSAKIVSTLIRKNDN